MRAVLAQLPEVEPVVIGMGPTLDLCRDLEVRPTDVKDPACLDQHRDLLDKSDLYLAFSNNCNVDRVVEFGLPLAFVDIHFATKRRETAAMRHAAAYIIENHPGVQASLDRRAPRNPVLVGPMVAQDRPTGAPKRALLVNLGGACSPDLEPGRNTLYPARASETVDRVVGRLGLEAVTVAMGTRAASTVPPLSHALPRTLPPTAYRAALAASEVLLTAPGLNGPLEAFFLGIPVVFLPPQNLTQVFHLSTYAAADLAPAAQALLELVPGRGFRPGATEAEGTAAVLEALDGLGSHGWRAVEELVYQQLCWPGETLQALAARQQAWARSLGEHGPAAAAEAIRGVLR
ncbi:MAG: hypothetical protein H6742_15355 [Alphaproteobacteria bacterium]|nr:hypothetical protein [Alphaproteobacteria bacterium]